MNLFDIEVDLYEVEIVLLSDCLLVVCVIDFDEVLANVAHFFE